MSHQAVVAANAHFYSQHPEMVNNGKQTPIDPHDPRQDKLRREWMQAYAKHGGAVREIHPKEKANRIRQAKAETSEQPSNVGTAVPLAQCPGKKVTSPDYRAVAQAPKPKKPSTTCRLLSAQYTCEHGRQPREDGVLCVVPDSYLSIGDKIACKAKAAGGCGDHVEWSISGFWTSTERGTGTDFNAKTFRPDTSGWLGLHKVAAQTYRVNATACEGGAPSLEVRAYPPEKLEAKLDFTKIRDAIKEGLKLAPLSEPDKVELNFMDISISCAEHWKEDKNSPYAFCECEVNGGADPLIKLERAFPIYPLSLVPPGLEDYIKLGLYITLSGELSFTIDWIGRYWSNSGQWQHDKFQAELTGKIEGELSANLYLASKDLLKAEIAGLTSFSGEATGTTGGEPAIKLELLWDGLEAVITLEVAWGFFEYERIYPILDKRKIANGRLPLGSDEADS